jgi:hypothetical protein
VRLDRCGELEEHITAQVGDAEIENEEIEMLGTKERVCLLARLNGKHVVARAAERDRQGSTDRRLVIDHKHT